MNDYLRLIISVSKLKEVCGETQNHLENSLYKEAVQTSADLRNLFTYEIGVRYCFTLMVWMHLGRHG